VKRLQNRIAESKFALPLTLVYAILVWAAGGMLVNRQMWVPFGCMVISSYLMMELNNINVLIRIYSRMVSCSFLVLTAMATMTFADMQGAIVQLCVIAFYMSLFQSYQDKESSGWVFYAFFCLGMASLTFIQIVFFVPFLWIMLWRNMMSLSWRTFWASIIGLLAPYWFVGTYYLVVGHPEHLASHVASIASFHPLLDYQMLDEHLVVSLVFVLLLGIIGTIHFLRNSFFDKIRTRMIYYLLITMLCLSVVFAVLQPQHAQVLLRIMTVSTSILIAHFIALTKTRLTNVTFILLIVLSLVITVYNLWIPSLLF